MSISTGCTEFAARVIHDVRVKSHEKDYESLNTCTYVHYAHLH